MADTINDIIIPFDQWVSLNQLSGVAIGLSMRLQLKGTSWVLVQQSNAQPFPSDSDGVVFTNLRHASATGYVEAGGSEVWARCVDKGHISKMNVQPT